jgi:putative transposase
VTSVDVVLFFQWPQRAADLSALWHKPTDFLSLEAPIRSPRPEHSGGAFASTTSGAPTEQVLALRQRYPRWGKDKLAVLLRRERCYVSISMVGRILMDLKRRGTLHETPKVALLRRARRKLRNRPWAIRKPKHWRIAQPGDLVEIDTKEIRLRRGVLLKHFSAKDVVSRWDVVEAHQRATSLAAARFLDTLLARAGSLYGQNCAGRRRK